MAVVALLVALGLLILLARSADLDVGRLATSLANVHAFAVVPLVAGMAFMTWCSARTWRLIVEQTTASAATRPPPYTYFVYTAFGMLMGQFLPPHVSIATSRSLGLMLQRRGTIVQGTSATVFEQLFDMLLACFCAIGTLLTIVLHLAATAWLLTTTGCVISGIVLTPLLAGLSLAMLKSAERRTHLASRAGRSLSTLTALLERLKVLHSPFIRRLFVLSVLRYLGLIVSAYAVVLAGDLSIAGWQIAAVMPFVVLAVLLSFAPGGLGVNEWTYASALVVFGVPFATGVEFALLNRILNFVGAAAVAVIGGVMLLAHSQRRP